MKIKISLVPENIPQMLTESSQNEVETLTSACLDASEKTLRKWMLKTMQHVRKCLPKWIPKSLENP